MDQRADRQEAGCPSPGDQSSAETELRACRLCPRECGADRLRGETGFCGMTAAVTAARAALHYWEEPCISGYPGEDERLHCGTGQERPVLPDAARCRGSGAVFFSGCNLRCVYCQNREIASGKAGEEITAERLAEIFLELQEQKACNINLVTPTPWIPQIAEAVRTARSRGLAVPVVFNCGGYESVRALRLLEGVVDVYLTDFKYMDPETARLYSAAPDYPKAAAAALGEMMRQAPEPVFDADGIMTKGVIVRHLLLPGHVRDACAVTDYVYDTCGDRVWLSLLRQYTPMSGVGERYPGLARPVTTREYNRWVAHVTERGIRNCFIQERGTEKESFIPAFDGEGIRKVEKE